MVWSNLTDAESQDFSGGVLMGYLPVAVDKPAPTSAKKSTVYPNPASSDAVFIDGFTEGDGKGTLQLVNAQGQVVAIQQTLFTNEPISFNNLQALPRGLYTLVISSQGRQQSLRLLLR
jgi:hypothetical protein